MKIYKAKVKTERELLASGWEREETGNYRRAYVKMTSEYDLHITPSMADYCGDKIEVKSYECEYGADDGHLWYVGVEGRLWRDDMLTNITELEETVNISLTPLEIEKVRACIEYQVKHFEGIVNQEFDNEDATMIMEFYTQLANKFEV